MPPPISLENLSTDERHQILEQAFVQEKVKRPDAKMFLIDITELNSYLDGSEPEISGTSHFQLIVANDGHYSAVDIRISGGRRQGLILDAANNPVFAQIYFAAQSQGYEIIAASGFAPDLGRENIQKDRGSCAMFALDHCIQLSHESSDRLYTLVDTCIRERQSNLFWSDLPPNFVWNTQSIRLLKVYEQRLGDQADELLSVPMPNGMSFKQYLAEGVVEIDGQMWNDSINQHVLANALPKTNVTQSYREALLTIQDAQSSLPLGNSKIQFN